MAKALFSLKARCIGIDGISILQIDVTSLESVRYAAAKIHEHNGTLSTLYNNSGLAQRRMISKRQKNKSTSSF